MKIKSLLLLGLMTMFGMNAFAQTDYKKDGIWYKIAADGKSATVNAISAKMSDASAAAITIPTSFVDGDGNTVPVVGFESSWYSPKSINYYEGSTPQVETTKDITKLTKTLSIDVTNHKAALSSTEIAGFTILEKLVLSGTFTPGGTVSDYKYNVAGKLKTVDLSNLKGKDKVIIVAGTFQTNSTLESITLPAQATVIEANAFDNASALKAIDLTNVTEIGDYAFDGCANANFKSLTIGSKVAKGKIGTGAFQNMTKLESVTIDNSNLEAVGAWFVNDAALKSVTITSTSIKKIDDNAFAVAPIETLNLSGATALETIGASAFAAYKPTKIDLSDLATLTTVDATSFPANAYTSVKLAGTKLDDTNFGNALTWLGSSAASLKTMTFPGKITKVPANAFKNFTKLAEITLTKNITAIETSAFDGSGLTAIKISGKVATIDSRAFADCASLASVDFSEAAELTTIAGNAFTGDVKLLALDLSGAAKLATISSTSFPGNAYTSVLLSGTALDDANFQKFDFTPAQASLKEVTMPAGITYIPSNLFQGFKALTSVSIPKNVTSINPFAFEGSGLTAVKIRENVAVIGTSAFENCAALATANFTEATGLVLIDDDAFANTAITEVAIPAAAAFTMGNRVFMNAKLKSFSGKGMTGDLGMSVFENNAKLTGIKIPKGTTGILANAFAGCKSLATVTMEFGATDDALATNGIGAGAFKDCAALTSLDLSTTKITDLDNANIFQGCTSLAEITFPESLTTMDSWSLFSDCPIENFVAPGIASCGVLFGTYWDKSAGTYLARDAKHANTTLKSVVIGGDVDPFCFAYCTALETVEYTDPYFWGDVVDANAFDHCTALTTFTYEPKGTVAWQVVDDNAFWGCVPFVHFITNSNYMDYIVANNKGLAPVNATFGDAEITSVKTVQDKANEKQFIAKFVNNSWNDLYIDAADAKVYSIYVDGETAYFQACRTYDNKYYVSTGDHVIIKTEEEKEVNINVDPTFPGYSSIGFDDIYDSKAGDDLAAVQAGAGVSAGSYLYRLTNTDDQGFGFTYFSGTNIKEGQFFIACSKKPEGAGRLEIVWLDEDGNVENATAIQGVKKALDQNDGAIYNLQGVRVQKAQKGLYIQNGKKIFVK